MVALKSLTSFTPHYAEDVTYSIAALQTQQDDNVDLLHLLQSLFSQDWANFTERLGVHGLQRAEEIDEKQLCRWASDRGQVL